MKSVFLALLMTLSAATGAEAATRYEIDPTNATITFSITKWGVLREEGSFREFTGAIEFDERQPERASVSFRIRSHSIDTKNSTRDQTLRSEDFLHVARFPEMTFRSLRVAPQSANVVAVTGELTIRGVTRRIAVPVLLTGLRAEPSARVARFETTFAIDRRDFNVLGSRWSAGTPGVLGHTVTIRIVAEGTAR